MSLSLSLSYRVPPNSPSCPQKPKGTCFSYSPGSASSIQCSLRLDTMTSGLHSVFLDLSPRLCLVWSQYPQPLSSFSTDLLSFGDLTHSLTPLQFPDDPKLRSQAFPMLTWLFVIPTLTFRRNLTNPTRNLTSSFTKQNKTKRYLWHSWQGACLSCIRPVGHTCSSSTWEVEKGVSAVQGHPQTHRSHTKAEWLQSAAMQALADLRQAKLSSG